jgi:hypothetical protein
VTDVYSLELRQAAAANVAVDPVALDGLLLTLTAVNGASTAAAGVQESWLLTFGALWIGPPGPKGDQGEPGINGAGYQHTQAVASATWTVNHNLGFFPGTTVYSTGGAEVEAEVLNVSVNQVLIYFAAPYAGSARCI